MRRLFKGGAYSAKHSRPFAARLLRGTKPPWRRAREALRQEKQTAHIISNGYVLCLSSVPQYVCCSPAQRFLYHVTD